jgi:hypothetical protein
VPEIYIGANRSPNSSYATASLLNTIIEPTVVRPFKFESIRIPVHDFQSTVALNVVKASDKYPLSQVRESIQFQYSF